MKWLQVAGVSLVVAAIVWFEWQHLSNGRKKERTALITVAALGWSASVILLLFPETPGPVALFDWLFKPLTGKMK